MVLGALIFDPEAAKPAPPRVRTRNSVNRPGKIISLLVLHKAERFSRRESNSQAVADVESGRIFDDVFLRQLVRNAVTALQTSKRAQGLEAAGKARQFVAT